MKIIQVVLITAAMFILNGCPAEDEPKGCIDDSKICKDCACIEIYEPVCGCDGQTYGNSCYAGIAGVTQFVEGTCNPEN